MVKDCLIVIGIHKSENREKNENYGGLIGPVFKFFKNLNEDKNSNDKMAKEINKDLNETTKGNEINNTNNENTLNEMTIIYNYNVKDNVLISFYIQPDLLDSLEENLGKIRIFGSYFVENNKNNCYLLIDGQQKELCSYLELNENQKEKGLLEIKLIENKSITDMSYIFSECINLESLPDISKWDAKNVTNMSYMLYSCRLLNSIPDISKWDDTESVTNMSQLFCWCNSLESLPDISKWNTENVVNMKNMFKRCNSLISFPNISKWKLNEKLEKDSMFKGCNTNIILKI